MRGNGRIRKRRLNCICGWKHQRRCLSALLACGAAGGDAHCTVLYRLRSVESGPSGRDRQLNISVHRWNTLISANDLVTIADTVAATAVESLQAVHGPSEEDNRVLREQDSASSHQHVLHRQLPIVQVRKI